MPIRLTENERLRVKLAEAEADARAYYLAWQEAAAERDALRAALAGSATPPKSED